MKPLVVVLASSTLTPDAGYEGQELLNDRTCYEVECPPTAADDATIAVKDRFGNREFARMKAAEICTPAEQVP